MSKFSRTRKAICRISRLEAWICGRRDWKKGTASRETWKQSYKKARKNNNLLRQAFKEWSFNPPEKLPCKYRDAMDMWNGSIWRHIIPD